MNITSLIPFTEHWASIYKPMSHHPQTNKRFYCIESIANLTNFAATLPKAQSPLVCMETNIGGSITGKFFMPEYNVYFFAMAKQKIQQNDIEDAAAKEEAMQHAFSYLNYIRQEQKAHEDQRDFILQGLDLDNVRFETFGPMFNRWFCVGLSMVDLAKYSRCVNPEDYLVNFSFNEYHHEK